MHRIDVVYHTPVVRFERILGLDLPEAIAFLIENINFCEYIQIVDDNDTIVYCNPN